MRVLLCSGLFLGTAATAAAEPSVQPTAKPSTQRSERPEQSERGAHGGSAAAHGFVSADSLLEFTALKSRFTAGYGEAETWLGLGLDPRVEVDHLGVFLGPRLHAGPVEVTSGAFGAYSIRRSFLPVREAYTRDDAEQRLGGAHATYVGVSTALRWQLVLGRGLLESKSEVASVLGVPKDRRVFVEHLNAIDGGSWLFEQRLAYTHQVPGFTELSLGAAAEWVRMDARKKDVLRAGPRAVLTLSEAVALRFELLPVVESPDTLGLAGGRFELGVWYGWLP